MSCKFSSDSGKIWVTAKTYSDDNLAWAKKAEEELRDAIINRHLNGTDAEHEAAESLRESDKLKMQEAGECLLKDLRTDWTLSLLADTINMERRTLTRHFKQYYGKSVLEFFVQKRLEKAIELMLRNRDMLIKEIAHEAGYDPSEFSKIFKGKYGKTPTAFRKRLLKILQRINGKEKHSRDQMPDR